MNIIQTKPEDVGGAHSITCGQQEYDEISFSPAVLAIHTTEDLVNLGACQNVGKPRMAKMLHCCDSKREIAF